VKQAGQILEYFARSYFANRDDAELFRWRWLS
jgi:hypothetical protein